MHVIAAKAVAFGEALEPGFRDYAAAVAANARSLAGRLIDRGYDIVSGGTDTHLMLVDLRRQGLKGNVVEDVLERAGMTCNKNGVPFDPEKPTVTSGVRLGSSAATTRGFGRAEFETIGDWIADVLDALGEGREESRIEAVRGEVEALCARYPIYGGAAD